MSLDRNMGFNDTPEDKPVPLKKCKHKNIREWGTGKSWCEDCKKYVSRYY